jgi:hypothetical protein
MWCCLFPSFVIRKSRNLAAWIHGARVGINSHQIAALCLPQEQAAVRCGKGSYDAGGIGFDVSDEM